MNYKIPIRHWPDVLFFSDLKNWPLSKLETEDVKGCRAGEGESLPKMVPRWNDDDDDDDLDGDDHDDDNNGAGEGGVIIKDCPGVKWW